MARIVTTIAVVFNRFDEIAADLQPGADAISKETAEAILGGYRQWAREDTGAQKASGYVITPDESGYADAIAAAKGKNEKAEMLAEVEAPPAHSVYVAIAAAYSAINEYGGQGRAGDGALTQAAEAERQSYYDKLRALIEKSL